MLAQHLKIIGFNHSKNDTVTRKMLKVYTQGLGVADPKYAQRILVGWIPLLNANKFCIFFHAPYFNEEGIQVIYRIIG